MTGFYSSAETIVPELVRVIRLVLSFEKANMPYEIIAKAFIDVLKFCAKCSCTRWGKLLLLYPAPKIRLQCLVIAGYCVSIYSFGASFLFRTDVPILFQLAMFLLQKVSNLVDSGDKEFRTSFSLPPTTGHPALN